MNNRRKITDYKLISVFILIWIAGALLINFTLTNDISDRYLCSDDGYDNISFQSGDDIRISDNNTLKKGIYTVTVDYYASDTVSLKMLSPLSYDADSDGIRYFLETSLDKDKTQFVIDVTLDNDYFDVYLVANSDSDTVFRVSQVTIESEAGLYNNSTVLFISYFIFFTLVLACIYYVFSSDKSRKEKTTETIVIIGLAAIVIFASLPLFSNAIINGHDITFHHSRVDSIAQSLLSGEFPSMTGMGFNGGYGYMNAAFYPQAFLYFPALLIILGANVSTSINVLGFWINILAVLVSYYTFYKITKNKYFAVVISSVYVLSFYRLTNLYIRLSLGEFVFLTFLPLFIYAIYTIVFTDKPNKFALIVACTGIFQSHILGTALAAFAGGFIMLFGFIYLAIKKRPIVIKLKVLMASLASVIALNLFFLVRFLYYYRLDFMMFDTDLNITKNFNGHPISFLSLFEIIPNTNVNRIFTALGVPVIMILILSIILIVSLLIRKKRGLAVPVILMAFAFVSIALTVLNNLWNAAFSIDFIREIAATLQFTFRFHSLTVAFVCLLFGFVVPKLNKKHVCTFIVGLLILSGINTYLFYSKANIQFLPENNSYLDSNAPEEYMLNGTDYAKNLAKTKKVITTKPILIDRYHKQAAHIELEFSDNIYENNIVQLPLFYYPGYRATVNNMHVPIIYDEYGILGVILPTEEQGILKVFFRMPLIITIANGVSLGYLIFTVGCYFKMKNKKSFDQAQREKTNSKKIYKLMKN